MSRGLAKIDLFELSHLFTKYRIKSFFENLNKNRYKTKDGAGVSLLRVIGGPIPSKSVDPFLMLDAFKSENPNDYIAGFPSHPHRGQQTLTYMIDGIMEHKDNKGNKGLLKPGMVQVMNAARGEGKFGPEGYEKVVADQHIGVLENKDRVTINDNEITPNKLDGIAGENGVRFLFLSAKPLREPIVQHGPFVMNTQKEIQQAFFDYEMGRF
ncbi:hypothetical protein ACTFIT_011253 [Dictyostelium discoideum]